MSRYEYTEFTGTGWGRRFYVTAWHVGRGIASELGGEWRVRRQVNYAGRWRLDGGRQPEWREGTLR